MSLPADLDAERALITAVLLSQQAFLDVTMMIEPGHFFKPAHQHIWEAIEQCAPDTNDPILVAGRLRANGFEGDEYTASGLNGFYCDPSIPATCISHALRYARRIVEEAARRGFIHAISEGAEKMSTGIDAAVARDDLISKLQDISTVDEIREPMNADDFAESVTVEYDWLIPDFLERRDRLMLTGSEGAGKSTLFSQIGFMAAAGIHPWTQEQIEPVTVLLVDLENDGRKLARRIRLMRWAINNTKNLPERWSPDRMRIECHNEGIDLMKPTDRDWLASVCEGAGADLLVIGPVYRMVKGVANKNDAGGEDQARQITAAIDQLRQRYDVAVIIEAHAPHGSLSGGRDLRPFGSSVWMRWSDFGIGLRPEPSGERDAYEFIHWREDRDERVWPKVLYKHSKPWPWLASMH